MIKGLSTKDVEQRVQNHQVNGTTKRLTKSKKEIILENVVTYFNIVNTVLFVIVFLTGKITNGTFYITIIFNALIGIVQSLKSKRLLDKMSIIIATKVKTLRDEQWQDIMIEDIVMDDVLRLRSGEQIPVDCEILEGNLEVNESVLTGESNTIVKSVSDHIYGGTIITAGDAIVRVIRVGKQCVASQILEEAQKEKKAQSKLHQNLEGLIRIISIAIIPTGIILFYVQFHYINMTWQDSALKTVAAVVGMIPEGLVVLTSMALAVSTMRLSRQKVLVQDLYSIESLARVDTICFDKTGTLTKGEMEVSEVIPLLDYSSSYVNDIMRSYLSNSTNPNPTDVALIQHFQPERIYETAEVLPFSSDRKFAGASLVGQGSFYIGATNFLFPDGSPAVNAFLSALTMEGKRVLVLARSKQDTISKTLPDDLEPIAMIGIRDILRDNVQELVKYLGSQEIAIKVISGDDPATVSSLALQAGIPNATKYANLSSNTETIEEMAEKYTVFGRVLPSQKMELVKAFQKQGHTVAMTGDGVNDVPALKSADVSIAMAAGSSAAKDSSNIVLLNNDFAQIPSIIDEGRRVINNITRASSMYLVKTTFSILLSIYVIILHQQYPFLPIHLSIISAFGVGIPTFFLQLEPSFEKVPNDFFKRAFRKAIPSGIAVFIMTILCILVNRAFFLPEERFYAIFVTLTSFIYLYTLFKVYYPPTKLRIAIVICIAIALVTLLVVFGELLTVKYQWTSLLVIIPNIILIPYLIQGISNLYDKLANRLQKFNDWILRHVLKKSR